MAVDEQQPKITAVVLTLNEEKHLRRCLDSLVPHCREIIVVDSGSTDATESIARQGGARFVVNPWVNHAAQFNFGLTLVSDQCDWVLRVDADEYLQGPWYQAFASYLVRRPHLSGVAIRRVIMFRGKPMRFGLSRTWQLRLFRNGRGACEARWMDEHIVVDGQVGQLGIRLIDDNRNDVRWWTQKHLGYADLEAIDLLMNEHHDTLPSGMSRQARVKRAIKDKVYRHLPVALRATLFFLIRYFVFFGFLDGRRGFVFHFLQGWWYRLYVDLRVQEIEALVRSDRVDLPEAIRQLTGFEVDGVRRA